MILQPGQELLHFRILQKIGQGGMGSVWKAEDLKLKRVVSLKFITRESEAARHRFLQEARSASALNHPNIVTIYSIENVESVDFIVMEFVEGKSLTERIREGAIPVETVARIGAQVADALAAAHAAGIIHRDIKAANIMITSSGQAKVLDFGLAKTINLQKELNPEMSTVFEATQPGMIVGTVVYMSPEQSRGESLDPRSDIFSLGSVLYEAATGKLPFEGRSLLEILHQIATMDPPLPSSIRSDLPAALDGILLRCLAKNREQRYTASELAQELRNLQTTSTPAVTAALVMPAVEEVVLEKRLIVGRDAQLSQMQSLLDQAVSGTGQIAFVTGEPGMGKTSLCEQFLRGLQTNHAGVLLSRGRCIEQYGSGEAYLPFLDAIGTLLMSSLREPLSNLLRTYAPTWYLQFPAVIASGGAIDKLQQEVAGATKERMLREMRDALFALTSSSPLVLLLEDLHWADPSTIDLLRYLSTRLANLRIFILVTFREEEVELGNHPLKSFRLEMRTHQAVTEIPLSSLNVQQIQRFVDESYPSNTFSSQLAQMLFAKTEGHPLFVADLASYLQDKNVLIRKNEHWELAVPLSEMELEVPESVRSMIAKKLEALTDDDRRVLQYACIEGEEFSSILLAELLETDELALEDQLGKLEKTYRLLKTVTEEELPDGSLTTKYRFAHALYRNLLYSDLLTKRRILLHRRQGELLLKHYARQTSRIAAQLASHFQIGRDFERAVEFFSVAADNAARIYANSEATLLYRKALQQIEELQNKDPENQQKWDSQTAKVQEGLADMLALAGKQTEAIQQYLIAEAKMPREQNVGRARVLRKVAKAAETQRQLEEASKYYGLALEQVGSGEQSQDAQHELLEIQLDKMWFHYTQNQMDEMEQLLESTKPELEKRGTAVQRSKFFQYYLLLAYRRKRYVISDGMMEHAFKSLEAAKESANLLEIATAHFVLGFASLWHKDLHRAEENLETALQMADRLGNAILQSRCITYITVAYRRLGDLEKAREFAERSLAFCTEVNMVEYIATAKANFAWLAFRAQNFQDTVECASAAYETWRSLKIVYPFFGLALWPLISALVKKDRVQEAVGYLQALLEPSQQKLPDDIAREIQAALQGATLDHLGACFSWAEKEGYL